MANSYYSARMHVRVTRQISGKYNAIFNYLNRVGLNLHEGGDSLPARRKPLAEMVTRDAFMVDGVAVGVSAVKPFGGQGGGYIRLSLMAQHDVRRAVSRIGRRFPGLETHLECVPYDGESP